MSASLREAGRAIFAAAMQAVDVRAAVKRHVAVRDGVLHLAEQTIASHGIDWVLVVAMGKAAVPMFEAAIESLSGIPYKAVVIAPPETLPAGMCDSPDVRFLWGVHPTPSIHSLHAADALLELLASTTERTVVLFLVSGGASAMVERPLDTAITLDDLAVFSRALVGSGLNITEINTLRKHLSAVKGGRLAQAAAAAAMQCTLLISDVPAASPDAIASGPSLPDSTTVSDARRLFTRLQQAGPAPSSIVRWFENAALPETPKSGDEAFARAHWRTVLSSEHLAQTAVQAAEAAGFYAVIDNTCDDWEYRDAGRYLLERALQLAIQYGRVCLVSVGEIAVAVPRHAGEGGRNQQFALWCATELARRHLNAAVLSAGSDGIDGQSNAAGAVCDESTMARAAAAGYNIEDTLASFHSAPLLRATADTIHTGPTGNNLRDVRLVLVSSLPSKCLGSYVW